MMESSQGSADAVSSEFQPYRIMYLCHGELREVLEHPAHMHLLETPLPFTDPSRYRYTIVAAFHAGEQPLHSTVCACSLLCCSHVGSRLSLHRYRKMHGHAN